MFDWVPLEYYRNIYNYILLAIFFLVIIYSEKYKLLDKNNLFNVNILFYLLFVFSLLYIGFRPISGKYFTDMATYNLNFNRYKIEGLSAIRDKDVLFQYFTYYCSRIMSANYYFFLLATMYIVPLYVVSKVNFKKGAFYAFVLFIGSFSFWAYGTNGIRNGIATSIFLLVFATNKKWIQLIIMLLAYNFHSSMLVPSIAFVIATFYRNPKYILYGWLACIPISLLGGDMLQSFFAGLIEDNRTSYLTAGNKNNDNFSSTGFRWDFVFYSASAVFAGWYYIFKKNFEDKRYNLIYCTYVIANAFWILVIKANFSNRFAYLSWFMMALVIIYPLLKEYIFKEQYKKIGYIMLAYFGFTFLMSVILK